MTKLRENDYRFFFFLFFLFYFFNLYCKNTCLSIFFLPTRYSIYSDIGLLLQQLQGAAAATAATITMDVK
jgi:hypothetical protein